MIIRTIAVPILMCLAMAAADAQPGHGPDRDRPEFRIDRDGLPEDIEGKDVRELVEVLRFTRMSKALSLSKEETVAIMQIFDRYKNEAEELGDKRRRLVGELRTLIRDESEDTQLKESLDRIIAIEDRLADVRTEAFDAMCEGLTVEQQAKLYVFMHEFEGDVRRMIYRARGREDGDHDRPDGPRGPVRRDQNGQGEHRPDRSGNGERGPGRADGTSPVQPPAPPQ